ncbi:MAG: helix-turn-helix domain-containing protein [Pseudomonadota bacterium]
MDAAKIVFLNKGFKSATMEDIAIAAGLTKPTIYRYFQNKDILCYELFMPSLNEMGEQAKSLKEKMISNEINTGKMFIHTFFEGLLKVYFMSPDTFRIINSVIASGEFFKLRESIYSKMTEMVIQNLLSGREVLEIAMKKKLIQQYDPVLIGDVLYGFFIGTMEAANITIQATDKARDSNYHMSEMQKRIELAIDLVSKAIIYE